MNQYKIEKIIGVDHERCLIEIKNKDNKVFKVVECNGNAYGKEDYMMDYSKVIEETLSEKDIPHSYKVGDAVKGVLTLNATKISVSKFDEDFKQMGHYNGTSCKCLVKEIISDLEFIVEICEINEKVKLTYCMSVQKYEKYYKSNKLDIKINQEIYVSDADLWLDFIYICPNDGMLN